MKYYQIFGRNNCPWCVKATEVLENNELDFMMCDMEKSPALENNELDFMMCDMEKSPALLQHYKDLYNMRTVPIVLEVDLFEDEAKVIGGCSELIDYLGSTND
jgi:glutaredoxin